MRHPPTEYPTKGPPRGVPSLPGTTAPTQHTRHGDRGGDGGEPPSALRRYVRFSDLVEANIVGNWPSLLRLIDHESFPAGILIGRNTRAWPLDEVQNWLAARPSARKAVVLPPGRSPSRRCAKHP
jgi:predicted DNA-binding transcriptional regulator AlpA